MASTWKKLEIGIGDKKCKTLFIFVKKTIKNLKNMIKYIMYQNRK